MTDARKTLSLTQAQIETIVAALQAVSPRGGGSDQKALAEQIAGRADLALDHDAIREKMLEYSQAVVDDYLECIPS